jgi:hypothetical protein
VAVSELLKRLADVQRVPPRDHKLGQAGRPGGDAAATAQGDQLAVAGTAGEVATKRHRLS